MLVNKSNVDINNVAKSFETSWSLVWQEKLFVSQLAFLR